MISGPMRTALVNHYQVTYPKTFEGIPEAKILTGEYYHDSWLHIQSQQAGIEFLAENQKLTGYRIIDEQKYIWFLLRWS